MSASRHGSLAVSTWLLAIAALTAATSAEAAVRVVIEGIRGASLRDSLQRSTALYGYRDRSISQAQVERLFERAPDEIRKGLEPFGYYRPDVESKLERNGDDWVATFTIKVRPSVRVQAFDLQLGNVRLNDDGACIDVPPSTTPASVDMPGTEVAAPTPPPVDDDDELDARETASTPAASDGTGSTPRQRRRAPLPEPSASDRPELCRLLGLIRTRFPIQIGERLVHSRYESGKAAAQSAIEGAGFLRARQSLSRVDVRIAEDAATVRLHWQSGPRYRIGETTFEGSQFPDEFMRRWIQHRPGDYYSSDELLKFQRRLIDADYFGFVSVSPQLRNADGDTVPIVVQVAPAPRNVYTGGISVGTDSGFGVRGSMNRRWVNRRGHKANVEAELSQRLTAAAFNYEILRPGENLRSFNIGATHRRETTDSTESETTSVFAMENRWWKGWWRDLGVRALYGDYEIAKERNNSTLLFAEGRLTRRRANDDLFPTQGYSLTFEARAGSEALLSDTDFVQLRGEARYIHPLGEKQRAYLRATLGTTWVDDFNALPPTLRFFAGGDRTIRGYGYQAVGPEVTRCGFDLEHPEYCEDFVIGGKHLAVLSAEFERDIARSWAVAAFVDSGNAFTDTSSFKARTGVGMGVRWRSPVGLVRLDIGHGLDDAKNAVELHIVIGPDL